MAAIPQVVTDALNAYAEADEAYDGKVVALDAAHEVLVEKQNAVVDAENAVGDAAVAVDDAKGVKAGKYDELKNAIAAGFGDAP